MQLSLSITVPDDIRNEDLARYLREQADNAAGQIEMEIIDIPEVDDMIYIDTGDNNEEFEAVLHRSE